MFFFIWLDIQSIFLCWEFLKELLNENNIYIIKQKKTGLDSVLELSYKCHIFCKFCLTFSKKPPNQDRIFTNPLAVPKHLQNKNNLL